MEAPIEDEPPYFILLTTYISYLFLIMLGHVRDFFGKRFGDKKKYNSPQVQNGYAPLNEDFDNFYYRCLKLRPDDCLLALPLVSPVVSSRSWTANRMTSTRRTSTPVPILRL